MHPPKETCSECMPVSQWEEDVFEALEILRNGAAVTGDEQHANLFRQRCLELAFHRMCTSVVPDLIAKGLLQRRVEWDNLLDVSILFQNQCIRPDLAKAAREAWQTNNRMDSPASMAHQIGPGRPPGRRQGRSAPN